MKTCSRCEIEKPIDKFYRESRNRDGRRSECKACSRIYARSPAAKANQRRYYTSEHGKAVRQKYENSAKNQKYRKVYNESEAGRASQKKQREKPGHKEYMRQYQRKWKKTPKGKRANRRNRKLHTARLMGAEGTWSQEEWDTMCELSNHRCACCGKKRKLTVDHVIPLIDDGCNCIHNIQPLCLKCNASKSNRHVTDYRNEEIKDWLSTLSPCRH